MGLELGAEMLKQVDEFGWTHECRRKRALPKRSWQAWGKCKAAAADPVLSWELRAIIRGEI